MNPNYTFRIVGCLPDDQPVEFMRSTHPYCQSYWNFWTRGLDRAWTCWVEYTMAGKKTLTPRVKIVHRSGSAKGAFHIPAEELRATL